MPFFLRTGKALAEDRRTVTVGLKRASEAEALQDLEEPGADEERPAEIVFELSDDASIQIHVNAKVPGPGFTVAPAPFRLEVGSELDESQALDAYARLLLDAMVGDHMLFSTGEQVERLWEICAPVLDSSPDPLPYAKGSWGPDEAQELPIAPGWRLPESEG